jgi:hypothetical protein
MDISNLKNEELIDTYSGVIKELKKRKIIRTKNVVGELGEFLSVEYYNKTPGLPKLQTAPVGTQNIDAISRTGERYSIKSTSGNVTGVFYGLEPKGSSVPDKQKFEYVIICQFDDDCQLKAIYQLDWINFLKHKKWHSRMNAWNITITKEVINDSTIIYQV